MTIRGGVVPVVASGPILTSTVLHVHVCAVPERLPGLVREG